MVQGSPCLTCECAVQEGRQSPAPHPLVSPLLHPATPAASFMALPQGCRALRASCLRSAGAGVNFPLHTGRAKGREAAKPPKRPSPSPALHSGGSFNSIVSEKVLEGCWGGEEGCAGCGRCGASSGAWVQPGHEAALGALSLLLRGWSSPVPHFHPTHQTQCVSYVLLL